MAGIYALQIHIFHLLKNYKNNNEKKQPTCDVTYLILW